MDKLSIRKEIGALINSIKEHSDNIGDKEHIPQLELELILHKIEKLYQKSIVYNHLHSLRDNHFSEKKEDKVVAPSVKETSKVELPKQEPVKATELVDKPIDLFGATIPPAVEKPKQEKKIVEKKEEKAVANKIQKPAIADITKAIGINDKFQFANDLFAGNMQEYNIAIQQLNSAESLEAAMDYFSNLQMLYEWDMEKETLKRLVDLVDRRYS
jgi:hypothetical protein